MKTQQFFQSMTQKLTDWRRRYNASRRHLYLVKNNKQEEHRRLRVLSSTTKSVKQKSGVYGAILGCVSGKRSPLIFAIAVVSLTGVMGQKLYNQPQLQIGSIAPQTIRAPQTQNIEDNKKTEEQRKAASTSSIPVLMVDARINEEIQQNLDKLLDEGTEIRTAVGSFPFFDTLLLSISSQRYLRSCSNREWQALLLAVDNTGKYKSGLLAQKPTHGSGQVKQGRQFMNPPLSQSPPLPMSLSAKVLKSNNLFQNADFM